MNNNVVKADAMEKPAQSNNAQGGQQGATGEANGTQGDQQQGKSTNGVGEQQNGTQTAGSTNGKTQLQRIQALVLRLTKKHHKVIQPPTP